ncbi:MAG: DUF6447 family protein [Desulfuromonadaceae bacterium]|nr:DUF6447 family protein [Desulfuromonadaceae bacterium]MDD5106497.1 DUF6447 family protein [Desulfuromonadaceae bacterium]
MNIYPMITAAKRHAQAARFPQMLSTCQNIIDANGDNADALLEVGTLLLNFGYITKANECFTQAHQLTPKDLAPIANLANAARDAGEHHKCRRLNLQLLKQFPNNAIVRHSALVKMEYDADVSNTERLHQAKEWGNWAITKAGGKHKRQAMRPLTDHSLRIGYVSADICQHTVGLFVKDVLAAHKSGVVVYSSGKVNDWVTTEIKNSCGFRDVSALDDTALAEQVRKDKIDILVDLSGHTGGSRLTVFAHRPAPVQVSWLGYFATTGLPYIDAVLLDEWHAPSGTEAQFVEPIIRLPLGRFCYRPVPWAPNEVASPPCLNNGYVTFGSFNNTAKLNSGVYDVWAQVLVAVPDSRLILKWRTFADEPLCQKVKHEFSSRGIAPERIELRTASFHVDVLKEYADIDIALDPFPFTGGLTSCEALWMGVPVITWPQSRVVSRQTFSLLSVIGLQELSTNSAEGYVKIARTLATDMSRLQYLRNSMRTRMQESPLMDVAGFTTQLEETYHKLYQDIQQKNQHKKGTTMPLITIDNKEYELDLLPTKAKEQLASLQFVDAELQRLHGQIAVFQTARAAYSNALKEALPKTVDMSEVVVGNVK